MSFRKRSIPLSSNLPSRAGSSTSATRDEQAAGSGPAKLRSHPGVRPSAQFPYILTTSTGTSSLDELLGIGAGLALGSIFAIEEDGSTDYAGVLLSCFASQGILQEQEVFVGAPLGAWPLRGSLPGLVKESRSKSSKKEVESDGTAKEPTASQAEKMKIAWRYERLGVVGSESDKGMNEFLTL
jgi:elongator complex protein 4